MDINEYRIIDKDCTGEPNVEIVYINGPPEEFELCSLSYSSKGIDLRLVNEGAPQFNKITRELEDRLRKATSELAEIDLKIQKEVHEYQTQCQSIDQSVRTLTLLCEYLGII